MRSLALFLSLIFLAGCGKEKLGPRESAEVFFNLLRDGKTTEAYESAATSFKLTRSPKYFDARVRDLELPGYKSLVLGAPEERGGLMRVRGEFKLKDDKTLELNLGLAKESGLWKLIEAKRDPDAKGVVEDVFTVEARTPDTVEERSKAFLEPIATTLPTDRQIEVLAKTSLLEFGRAVKRGNFSDFFATLSDRWKYRGKDKQALTYTGLDDRRVADSDPLNSFGRITEEALLNAFQPFIAEKVDLYPIAKAVMKLSEPPRINSDGVLSIAGDFDCFVFQGAFPQEPMRMDFKLEYVFESSTWKLFGITVNITPPKEKDAKKEK